jgi:hypothetical protein
MTRVMTVLMLSLSGVAATAVPDARTPERRVGDGPFIEVWASAEVFERGEKVHVWFRAAEDAFITVMRIDTDGRVWVLYPQQPWHNNYVPAGHRLEVSSAGGGGRPHAFVVDDYPGTGYLFAVASRVPFDYRLFVEGDRWDYRNIAYYGRVTGDPYVALMDLIDQMVPASGYEDYSYDVYPYHVDERYEYPRFLCYDCHAYVAYPMWNPYLHSCLRFRLVVYDDPYYYPARAYAGTRVVYIRPRQLEARYVFQSRSGGESFITKVARRPVNPTGRRSAASEATAQDMGGVGAVPAPAREGSRVLESPRRRVTEDRSQGVPSRILLRYDQAPTNQTTVPAIPRLQRREQPTTVRLPVPLRPTEEQRPATTPQDPRRRLPSSRDSMVRRQTDPTTVRPATPTRKKAKPDTSSGVRRRPGG